MNLIDILQNQKEALDQADSILAKATQEGRGIHSLRTLDIRRCNGPECASRKTSGRPPSNQHTTRYRGQQNSRCLRLVAPAPARHGQTQMSAEYNESFIAFLRSGGKQTASALSEGFDPMFGGFALPIVAGDVPLHSMRAAAAVPTARVAMPSTSPTDGQIIPLAVPDLVSVPWQGQFPRLQTSNFQVNPRLGQPESRPKAEQQPTRS